MNVELLLWGVVPAVVGVGVAVLSTRSIGRAFGALQLGFGIPVVLVCLWSIWVLARIFVDGAYPTFVPHIFIACAAVLVRVQVLLAGRGGVNSHAARVTMSVAAGGSVAVIGAIAFVILGTNMRPHAFRTMGWPSLAVGVALGAVAAIATWRHSGGFVPTQS